MATLEENWKKLLSVIGNPAKCGGEAGTGCGAEIWWVTTKFKKAMPLNADAAPHWATCPKAQDFRRKK